MKEGGGGGQELPFRNVIFEKTFATMFLFRRFLKYGNTWTMFIFENFEKQTPISTHKNSVWSF